MRLLFAGLLSLIITQSLTNESLLSSNRQNFMSPQKDTASQTKLGTSKKPSTVLSTQLNFKDAMKRRSKSDKKPYRLPFTIV